MSLFKLCPDDAIVNTLRSVFNANIVRIPEARIRPLCVVAVIANKATFWGYLNDLIEGDFLDIRLDIEESQMADVSGKRSKSVSIDIGLQIMEGFLSGLSLPSAAISNQFTGAKTVSFSFQQVVRHFISPSHLGKLLKGHALDKSNPSNDIFFNQQARLLVTDSVIVSKDFSINVDKASSNDFTLDVPAIKEIIGKIKTDVKVTSSAGVDITFQGNTPLSFAFTCVQCEIDEAGRITIKPFSNATSFNVGESPEHQLLFNEPGMIEFANKDTIF